MERDTFITSQETLITSQVIYRKVQTALRSDAAPGPDQPVPVSKKFKQWLRPLKVKMFGEEYVVAREKYVDWDYLAFKKRIKFNSELDAGSFTIEFSDPNPERALRITQVLATSLTDLNRSIANEQTRKTVTFLGKKIDDTRAELAQSADQIVSFVRQNSFPNNERYVDLRYQSLLDTMAKVGEAKAKVLASQAMLKTLKTTAASLSDSMKGKISDFDTSKFEALQAEIRRYQLGKVQIRGGSAGSGDALLDEKLEQMKMELAKVAPTGDGKQLLELPRLKDLYQDVSRQQSSLESEVASASKYYEESNANLMENQREVARFPELQAKMSQMMIDHSRIVQVLTVLTELYYKNLIQSDSDINSLFVIEDPAIASTSSSSKPMMLLSLLVFVAVIIAALWAAHDMLRETIFSADQLKTLPLTSYIGSVPRFRARRGGLSIFAQAQINDTVSRLGYAIKKRIVGSKVPGHTLVVCGNEAKMGKSVSAVILAYSLQRKGLRVALVDFDVRAVDRNVMTHVPEGAVVHEIAPNLPVEATIKHAVRDQATTREPAIFHFSPSAEATGPQPVTMDGPIDTLLRALALLRREVDAIVIDGPPLFVSDSCLLVEQADSIILCCREGRSRVAEMEEAVASVERHRRPDTPVMSIMTQSGSGVELGSMARYRYSSERYRKTS